MIRRSRSVLGCMGVTPVTSANENVEGLQSQIISWLYLHVLGVDPAVISAVEAAATFGALQQTVGYLVMTAQLPIRSALPNAPMVAAPVTVEDNTIIDAPAATSTGQSVYQTTYTDDTGNLQTYISTDPGNVPAGSTSVEIPVPVGTSISSNGLVLPDGSVVGDDSITFIPTTPSSSLLVIPQSQSSQASQNQSLQNDAQPLPVLMPVTKKTSLTPFLLFGGAGLALLLLLRKK